MSLISFSEEERGQLDQLNTESMRASWRRGTSIHDDIAQKIETTKDQEKTETSEILKLEDDNPPADVVRFKMFQEGSRDKLISKKSTRYFV